VHRARYEEGVVLARLLGIRRGEPRLVREQHDLVLGRDGQAVAVDGQAHGHLEGARKLDDALAV
jgi:hypothetical protein